MMRAVDEYIEKQPSPQKEICRALRDIILKTFLDIKEEMKYGVPMYGEKYYIVGLRDSVNLGFTLKGLSKEEIALFEGTGKTMKHIKVRSIEDIDEARIIKLLKLVMERSQ
jgi:hypothetical protein